MRDVFHETRACSITQLRENRTDETSVILGQWRMDVISAKKKFCISFYVLRET